MDYRSDGKIYSSLMVPTTANSGEKYYTPVQTILVQTNRVNFYNNALLDFSAFASIASLGNFLPVVHLEFYSTSLQPAKMLSNWHR